MNILLTGANGYIGKRLLPALINKGHFVYACVRDKNTLHLSESLEQSVHIIEVDFLDKTSINALPLEIDLAFFLMHSLDNGSNLFSEKEETIAFHFNEYIEKTRAVKTIYLSGISNDNNLSKHLKSRQKTGAILKKSTVPVTILRAAIIIGSGGASFEIIRDLVEKLPLMIAPKWLNTKCQPIGIRNVIDYLVMAIENKEINGKTFDIGGPEILTYKQMLLEFAKIRGIRRWIWTVPVMTPRLSSYWLYFVTSTSFPIALNLVDSMKNEVVVKKGNINQYLPIKLLSYKESIALAFKRIEQNYVVSSWVDTELSDKKLHDFIEVPLNGTFQDVKKVSFDFKDTTHVLENVWSIGGERGWYYGNYLWRLRGYLDKFFGGVGLRRGRRSPTFLNAGDSLDFWRVLLADSEKRRLLLYAEMKLPGEAWLEFKITNDSLNKGCLVQTATFRPKGLLGRLYWYTMLPFHLFIFKNMAKNIVKYRVKNPKS